MNLTTENTAVVLDSTSDYPEAPARFSNMRFVPLYVRFGDETYRDYHYYKDRGWFESGYYYQAPLGPVKTLIGGLFDLLGKRMAAQA